MPAQRSVTAPGPPDDRTEPSPHRPRRKDLAALGTVAAAYALAQTAFMAAGTGLGWDETVYVSQVSPDTPAAFFSAPRARGISWLVAPLVTLTPSVPALRIFLALFSAAGLLTALWTWRRLLPLRVLTLAGALFAGLWVSLFYGPQAMPNLWVALAALAATGCVLRAAHDPADRRPLVGIAAAVALAALMRPSDAVWLVLPAACVAALLPGPRKAARLVALAAGAVLGAAPWVVEARLDYGGLLTRLHRAGEIQGGLGWNPSFGHHLRSLGGRTLCRPCDIPWTQPVTSLWWLTLPLLATAGVALAYRSGRTPGRAAAAAAATGLSMAAPYLLFVGYAAPRFLLPAYALLSLPVAVALARLFGAARSRPVLLGALCLVLAAHLTLQLMVTAQLAARSRTTHTAFGAVAQALRGQGLRAPCVISGEEAVRVAFRTGCASRQLLGGHDGSISAAALAALARTRPTAVLVEGGAPAPAWARTWRPYELPALPGMKTYRAYLGPAAIP
ncbi:hypothetical protein [Streptomyces sp. fd1-xmd]|uniref:hypothetical protein n=1 Tax=Streptomyces sp. fd1-xmd TaxID=1812480 RepID=UPI000990846E|nr:hypothetical protein [Streptomyces sp. fd1-xmd]AQT70910.1 hypothetical protein B1K54_03590 [Streptomyces sp. fd1-xmd]